MITEAEFDALLHKAWVVWPSNPPLPWYRRLYLWLGGEVTTKEQ